MPKPMIEEIKDIYQTFGDATIDKIEYVRDYCSSEFRHLTTYITCLNWKTKKWERVKFEFFNVNQFRCVETLQMQNSVVFEALLIKTNTKVIVDFFPIQVDGLGKLEEDPDSCFSIHCSNITYKILNELD